MVELWKLKLVMLTVTFIEDSMIT